MSAQIVPFPTRPRLAVVRETDAELIDLSDAMEREQIERLRRAPQVLRLATLSKIVEHMTFLIDTRTAIIWAIGEGHYANAEAAIDELRETQPAPETPPRAAALFREQAASLIRDLQCRLDEARMMFPNRSK